MIYKYIMSNFYNMRNILETEFNFICKCFYVAQVGLFDKSRLW